MGKIIDLTNKTFGQLTVLERDQSRKGSYWKCKCQCGNICSVRADHLKNRETLSCGCLQKERARKNGQKNAKDYTGYSYEWTTIIKPLYTSTAISQNREWLARCKCGKEFIINSSDIGKKKSCGCRPQIDYTGQRINNFIVTKFLYSDKQKGPLWECRCDCGKIFKCYSKDIKYRKSCGCIISYQEEQIEKFLKENEINYIRQYTFNDLIGRSNHKLRFDFAIFENQNLLFLIEYQGKQHYDKDSFFYSEEGNQRDKIKQEYCKRNNIKLLILNKNSNIQKEILEALIKNTPHA